MSRGKCHEFASFEEIERLQAHFKGNPNSNGYFAILEVDGNMKVSHRQLFDSTWKRNEAFIVDTPCRDRPSKENEESRLCFF